MTKIFGLFPKAVKAIGVDRAIGYTILGRVWSVCASVFNLWFIAHNLSKNEQGFYYTFGSILGLQIFFDLGLAYVVMQYASHEMVTLNIGDGRTVHGDDVAKARLASLTSFAARWYGFVAVLVLFLVLPSGLYFFSTTYHDDVSVNWVGPWILLNVATAGSLFLSPLVAIVEGTGQVAEVALMRTFQGILSSLVLWAALWGGLKLYASSFLSLFIFLFAAFWLFRRFGSFFKDLIKSKDPDHVVRWWEEIFPFQWKIALSWLSGYFIFQIYNPIIFAYHGAVAAGQMGMSLQIGVGISNVAIAWISTKASPFGQMIAKKDYELLDKTFFRSLWQSLALILLAAGGVFGAILFLRHIQNPFAQRVLDPLPLAMILTTAVINQVINAEAVYLRAHKKEPFLWPSVIGGVLAMATAYLVGKPYGAIGLCTANLVLTLTIGLGVGTTIFIRCRREWHRS